MDLSALAVSNKEVKSIHLEHPVLGLLYADEAKKKPVTIDVYSPSSDHIVALERRNVNAAIQRQKRGKEIDANFAEEKRVERLVAYTADIKGLELNNEPITPKNVETIYRNREFGWLHEQLESKLASWSSFLQD